MSAVPLPAAPVIGENERLGATLVLSMLVHGLISTYK